MEGAFDLDVSWSFCKEYYGLSLMVSWYVCFFYGLVELYCYFLSDIDSMGDCFGEGYTGVADFVAALTVCISTYIS